MEEDVLEGFGGERLGARAENKGLAADVEGIAV